MSKVKEITINETEKSIMEALATCENGQGMTLSEISDYVGKKLVSGNINALITRKGKVQVLGERGITCECCGHKKKVKEYALV